MDKSINRRDFISGSLMTLGATSLLPTDAFAFSNPLQATTIQQVIDLIIKDISGSPLEKTVDTIKSGDASQPVTGIVTTMFATIDVIEQAVRLKANFIIAHEPTFYNHLDETDWLEKDNVYRYKRELLEKNKIVVWRFHDYWHMNNPDGVRMGVLTVLDWKRYYDPMNPRVVIIPALSLKNVVGLVKARLGIERVRMIGDLNHICQRILLMPGASGGRSHIQQLKETQPDLIIVGELAEWETAEYVRDSRAMGTKRSLIVLGHSQSEEPGMKWLVQWLQPKIKDIKVTHVPSNNPFTFA
jgi:putative NIF3 family GTP cyclohydrolase 1 type 2